MPDDRGAPKGFTPFDLDLLQSDTVVDFHIFTWPETSARPVLYRSRNLPFTDEHRKRLMEAGSSRVFVLEEDGGVFDAYVERYLDKIVADPDLAVSEKAKVLYDTSLKLAIDVLDSPETHENLKRSEDLVRGTISYVLLGKDAFHELLSLKSYDYRTYTHSVNVCMIGLALAGQLGFSSQREMMDFGVGAIFHDVGKMKVPADVLRKSGPLNDDEWKMMKQHPLVGLELVRPHVDFPESGKAVILQHHEWVDASGYPNGRKSSEIHPFAKIAALADVFDALTSRRPYKDAIDSYPALQLMKEEVGAHFDEEYFRELVVLLGE